MSELTIIIFLIGIVLGFFLAYLLIHKLAESKYKVELEKWRIATIEGIKKDTLDRSRSVLKGKIGEQFAPLFPEFKYNHADARFLGNPIDYLVFDGYSEDKPINLIFLDVKKGKYAKLTKSQERVKEAVEKKKIKWQTLNLD